MQNLQLYLILIYFNAVTQSLSQLNYMGQAQKCGCTGGTDTISIFKINFVNIKIKTHYLDQEVVKKYSTA